MIKTEFIEVWGFRHAIRGMRNSYETWDKSDSYETHIENPETMNEAPFAYFIGENDMTLMRKLFREGESPRKFMRQIFVSMDITAPLYWWKQYATYKVGTTENSCSTMHTIMKKPITADDFSIERTINLLGAYEVEPLFDALNFIREYYNGLVKKEPHYQHQAYKDNVTPKDVFYAMIQLLPDGYMQRRTVTFNYENAANMIRWRETHKLDEWREFCRVLKSLPYMEDIRGYLYDVGEGSEDEAAED